MDTFDILNDGSYCLDAGAYLGIVPKALWTKYFNDNNNRLRIGTNLPFFIINGKSYLIDAGIGNVFDDKFMKIFSPEKSSDAENLIKNNYGIESVDRVLISHMHFDHCGHLYSKGILSRSEIYMQKKEMINFKKPNEFTRGSYVNRKIYGKIHYIDGSSRINSKIRVIHTGGHTSGHQAIIFEINSKKYMYGGDLFPSSFHIRPYYVTAIDTFPLESLKIKKMLVKKAINEHIIMIFNHDNNNTLGEISGTVNKPAFNKIDIK